MGEEEQALQQRLRDLAARVQAQTREIRALEKIEVLQDRNRDLETEIRALRERIAELHHVPRQGAGGKPGLRRARSAADSAPSHLRVCEEIVAGPRACLRRPGRQA